MRLHFDRSGILSLATLLLIVVTVSACGDDDGPPTAAPHPEAPTVISMSPLDQATNVPLNTTISATFSETVRAATVNTTTFTVGGVTGTVALNNGKVATFTPAGQLSPGTPYTATVTTGVKDLSNDSLAADVLWSFTTGTSQAPTITRVAWTQDPGCTPGTPNGVTIVVSVNDPDTTPGNLTYSGLVTSCGTITGATTVVTCPQTGAYAGTVTVRDPEGNSDTAAFSFGPCNDGQITP